MSGRVNVLLATYNGARFLREQLESLRSQTHGPHLVTVRDDGSTDCTVCILSEWAASGLEISLSSGACAGAARNFLTLLANADGGCDYFAFCDQDDVWLPDKLERAVAAVGGCRSDGPVMYCSRAELVDEELGHLSYSRVPRRIGFANALVENVALGCTMVLNRYARDLVCRRLPQRAIMHDWWCYLVVSAFGRVIYDERPTVRYRQHGGNVFGAAPSRARLFRRRFSRLLRLPPGAKLLGDQIEEFRACFGDAVGPEYKAVLDRFLMIRGNLWDRLSYSAAMDVCRQNWLDNALLRAVIVMGRA